MDSLFFLQLVKSSPFPDGKRSWTIINKNISSKQKQLKKLHTAYYNLACDELLVKTYQNDNTVRRKENTYDL